MPAAASAKIRLFQSLYPELNAGRKLELERCLRQNLSIGVFDEICLLLEGDAQPEVDDRRLSIFKVNHRPTFEDFFDLANSRVLSECDLSVIANSDIFFDKSVCLLSDFLQYDTCAALSRWDMLPNGDWRLFNRSDSQDAWVFRGSIRPVSSDFCVGIPRCDNRILYELKRAGYSVINPAFSIRSMHLHAGTRPEYPAVITGAFVPPPYEYLYPENLVSLWTYIKGRLKGRYSEFRWRIDKRAARNCFFLRFGRQTVRQLRRAWTATFCRET